MATEDAALNAQRAERCKAELESRAFRDRLRSAIRKQADAWGIRFDQAQALLLDRKAIA